MIVIPAIDIRNGKCVRLIQGDPGRETVYADDPVKQAIKFQDEGAELLHVVDLDGAFSGRPVNREVVAAIAGAVDIPIEIGGGIRNRETVEHYLSCGIERIIMGTAILSDDFKEIVGRFSRYLVAGIDARDSMVAVKGWKEVSSVRVMDVIGEVMNRGVNDVIYTDISTDGMLTGPNFAAVESILAEFQGLRLVASGGVSSAEDIYRLDGYSGQGLWGCIVGKAIYDGRVDLPGTIRTLKSRRQYG